MSSIKFFYENVIPKRKRSNIVPAIDTTKTSPKKNAAVIARHFKLGGERL